MNEIERLQQLAGITEIRVNNPQKPKLSVDLLKKINKLINFDPWTSEEENIIYNIMGYYINDSFIHLISSEINGEGVFESYPKYINEPEIQGNLEGFINNWYKLPNQILKKL